MGTRLQLLDCWWRVCRYKSLIDVYGLALSPSTRPRPHAAGNGWDYDYRYRSVGHYCMVYLYTWSVKFYHQHVIKQEPITIGHLHKVTQSWVQDWHVRQNRFHYTKLYCVLRQIYKLDQIINSIMSNLPACVRPYINCLNVIFHEAKGWVEYQVVINPDTQHSIVCLFKTSG